MTPSNPFFFDTDAEAIAALEAEGRRLKKIAIKHWRLYLSSYNPVVYVMTGKAEKSIKLGKVRRLDAFTFGIELSFLNELAYHDSVMGGKKGHAIMLISEGWKVKRGKHKDVYRFGYYEGYGYLHNVVKEFNAGARRGITLEVNWKGDPYIPKAKGTKSK